MLICVLLSPIWSHVFDSETEKEEEKEGASTTQLRLLNEEGGLKGALSRLPGNSAIILSARAMRLCNTWKSRVTFQWANAAECWMLSGCCEFLVLCLLSLLSF